MKWKDRIVIVTGAGRGIGSGVAEKYAEAGATVIVADMLETEGKATEEAISLQGGKAKYVACDVRSEEDLIRLMESTAAEFGRIDALINNAGVSRFKSPYELSVAEWDDVLNTNVRSVFIASREAAKVMKEQPEGGAIVNISSTRSLMSEPNSEAYAASKGAIVSISHALAVSLGPDRIRVNCISPGWIETSDYAALREIDHLQHPAGRVGKPGDIARACLYFTDPDNSFVTGSHLVVDGGMTRKMMYEE